MLGKERVKRALKFEEVDRIPVIPPWIKDWAVDYFGYKRADLWNDDVKGAEVILKTLELLKFDGVEAMWDWCSIFDPLGCETKVDEFGNYTVVDKPVKQHKDLDRMEIPDFGRDPRVETSIETASLIREKAEELYLYAGPFAPFTLAGELRGIEDLIVDMYRNPDFVHDLLKFSTDVLLEDAKLYVDYVNAIIYSDPTASGDLISPTLFKNFAEPYLKRLVQETRSLGVDVLIHICGNTSDRLENIAEIRPDGYSMDSTVDLAYARLKLENKVAIIGNISSNSTLMGNELDVQKATREAIRKAGRRGFVLAASCDVSKGTPIKNLKTMIETAQNM